MIGVGFLAIINKTQIQVLHAFVGGNFILSQVPMGYALLHVEDAPAADADQRGSIGETTPLTARIV